MHPSGFLLEALVYLAAAVVAVPLFQRAGLGSVLGYLVAGVVIGPAVLGLIPDVEAVARVSELGVVLLLFLIGLELNPQRLWSLRRSIFGLGALQVGVTIAVVALAVRAAGAGWPAAFVVGAAAAMSSTAIAMQLLAERNLMGTPAGQSAFSVALFQDLAVIPLMLAIGLLAPAEGGNARGAIDLRAVATAVALVAGLIVGGRLLLRPLLRTVAATGMREVFVACALLLVVGSAWLTSSVGLSLALGSFIAGVLLADSEYRMELEVDIDPFKGLLMGLFFMSVGMSVDLALIAAQPLRVAALALAVVGAKLAVLSALGRLFGLRRADRWLFALSISQVGEFAFVLSSVALAARLFAPAEAALFNAVVAASMLTTPVLLLAHARWVAPRHDRAGREAPPRIDERRPVIVAGVGRFGQIVARLLYATGRPPTVIDHDPDQIELLRQFGWRLHYGDVSRPDVLAAAGAAEARLLVLAIDDPAALLRTVRHVQQHYPRLAMLARARSRTDAYELAALGVPFVRETFGSALDAAEQALVAMGEPALAAHRAARKFRRHDEVLLREAFALRGDRDKLIALTARGRRDLEQLLRAERGGGGLRDPASGPGPGPGPDDGRERADGFDEIRTAAGPGATDVEHARG